MCNQEDKENTGGKECRLQEPCEFPEGANILSSTSVYIKEEFSKPTTSMCNQEYKEKQVISLYRFLCFLIGSFYKFKVYFDQHINALIFHVDYCLTV
jgi:hypothetical protein